MYWGLNEEVEDRKRWKRQFIKHKEEIQVIFHNSRDLLISSILNDNIPLHVRQQLCHYDEDSVFDAQREKKNKKNRNLELALILCNLHGRCHSWLRISCYKLNFPHGFLFQRKGNGSSSFWGGCWVRYSHVTQLSHEVFNLFSSFNEKSCSWSQISSPPVWMLESSG